jgi:hypothetical protein
LRQLADVSGARYLGIGLGNGAAIREESAAEMRREIGIDLDGAASADGVSAKDMPTFTKNVKRANQC